MKIDKLVTVKSSPIILSANSIVTRSLVQTLNVVCHIKLQNKTRRHKQNAALGRSLYMNSKEMKAGKANREREGGNAHGMSKDVKLHDQMLCIIQDNTDDAHSFSRTEL